MTTDNMLPILRQFHNAATRQEQAALLLISPLSIILKYADVYRAACRKLQFEDGEVYVDLTVAALVAVRQADGTSFPDKHRPRAELEAALARFAAGPPLPPPSIEI
jgi:hypothetical protein